MGDRRYLIPVAMLLAVGALGGAFWFGSQPAPLALPGVSELDNSRQQLDEEDPLHMSGSTTPSPLPAAEDDPDSVSPDKAETAAPEIALHVPDYGVNIERGGAFIDLELFDTHSSRMDVAGFEPTLHRKVGSYWVEEDAIVDVNSNVIRCVGLGLPGLQPTGLEPGHYEITLTSEAKGCTRHSFDVARGEYRLERVELPVWSRTVCFTFVHEDGSPISHLPRLPRVISSSKSLEWIYHGYPPELKYRTPPVEPDPEEEPGSGTFGFGTASWVDTVRVKGDPPRYATDDGRWWVNVMAGCDTTVSFHLSEDLWGQKSYSFSSDFTETDAQMVTLKTPADFNDRVMNPGKLVESVSAGNSGILTPAIKIEVDPMNAPVREGYTRLVVRALSPGNPTMDVVPLSDKKNINPIRHGDLYWFEFISQSECLLQIHPGCDLGVVKQTVDVSAGGVVYVELCLPVKTIGMSGDGISPTLAGFAHTWTVELQSEAGPATRLNFQKTPAGWQALYRDDTQPDITHAAVTLRGADRFNRNPGSTRTTVTDRGDHYLVSRRRFGATEKGPIGNPLSLRAEISATELVPAIGQRPEWHKLLVLRAVDPNGAGMPGVQGLLLEYDDDVVAGQVRERCAARENCPIISRTDAGVYRATLTNLEAKPDPTQLRALMGDDAFEAFDTDAQRLWFARYGAWYRSNVRIRSDNHGYVATEMDALEPGKIYVLYLWGGSRNDLHPDARIVFKAEPSVTDLGALTLPLYKD